MALNDLTGTAWKFSQNKLTNLPSSTETKKYSVNFVFVNDIGTYKGTSVIDYYIYSQGDFGNIKIRSFQVVVGTPTTFKTLYTGERRTTYTEPHEPTELDIVTASNPPFYFYFPQNNAGTDATNSNLIYWFEQYAEQITPQIIYDLSSDINDFTVGSHTLTAVTTGTGYDPSSPSNAITFNMYSVTSSITSGSSSGITKLPQGGSGTITITPNSGYKLPSTVSVTSASYTYDSSTGVIMLSNPTGNVTITAVCEAQQSGYSVTITGHAHQYGGFDPIDVYDGSTPTHDNRIGKVDTAETPTTFTITSGYIYLLQQNIEDISTTGGVSFDSGGVGEALFTVSGNGTISCVSYPCFIEGTEITLADRTRKKVEDITMDDELLVWNFYEGKFDTAKPMWIMQPKETNIYNLVTFENGTWLGLVGSNGYHRIFNEEAKAFTHTGTDDTPIGTTTFCDDGFKTIVVGQHIIHNKVKYYNIITDKHYNLFANGILTSCRLSNRYAIEGMKYNTDKVNMSEAEVDEYIEGLSKK